MAEQNFDDLPLKERLRQARYLSRELSEHLTQAYLPRLAKLRLASKEFDVKQVSDQQVFDCTKAVLEAEEFTDALNEKLSRCLASIRSEMQGMLFTETSSSSSASLRQPKLEIDGLDVFDD